MPDVLSIDPRTGRSVEVVAQETTAEEVDALCQEALAAAAGLESLGRHGRAELLRVVARALEREGRAIVEVADRETALGSPRLEGELRRTCYQLRLFAEVLEEGSYLEAVIDNAGTTPTGPRPDLRRMLVPLGPVAVFGASNFPLAFSVAGGDTAAALAAGCPVVIKAHGSHPATSQLCFDVLAKAAAGMAPTGTFALVHGVAAGAALVGHPAIRAVGFTGSHSGAQGLLAVINQRPDPVPFFGELGSVNPVVVTPEAAAERGADVGRAAVVSFTLGGGQFCTKPGVLFVPSSVAGDALVNAMVADVRGVGPQWMLNEDIAQAYGAGTASLEGERGLSVLARGAEATGAGFEGVPLLLGTTVAELSPQVLAECFGPVTVVVRYTDEEELLVALATLPPSLTASVFRGAGETRLPLRLAGSLRQRAGRVIYDGFPTGVAVSWAQHHGGPWPSTNSQHTSVGATSVRRFLRPVAWQDAPSELLPTELQDGYVHVPRRVDGVLRLPE